MFPFEKPNIFVKGRMVVAAPCKTLLAVKTTVNGDQSLMKTMKPKRSMVIVNEDKGFIDQPNQVRKGSSSSQGGLQVCVHHLWRWLGRGEDDRHTQSPNLHPGLPTVLQLQVWLQYVSLVASMSVEVSFT